MYQQLFAFGAAFLGSAVESTEALTIVLAIGLTRGWRAPLAGAAAALVALIVLVVGFGAVVARIPDSYLKLVIGTLLLLFGLRWLHKAVLRSAGVVALHDEERAYRQTVEELRIAASERDWVGFILALKGVFLEGLEVVFIVIAVGGTGGLLLPWATAGGVLAMVAVGAAGVAVRKPLARVPENTLKYAVGVMLASLGTFWVGEGMGGRWPLDFVSIAGLIAVYFVASRVAVVLIRKPVTIVA